MTDPDRLRLAAIDEEDLAVVSAHVQDAVLKVGDMVYLPGEHRFAVAMNRFLWEKAVDGKRKEYERRRTALTFDRVSAVRTQGIDRNRPDAVLELLAIQFAPREPEAPEGEVTLVFAGGAAVRVSVEVIEVRLADLGAAWGTHARPEHDLDSETKPLR